MEELFVDKVQPRLLKRFSFSNTMKTLHQVQEMSTLGLIFYVLEDEGRVSAQESSNRKDSNVLRGVLLWSGLLEVVHQVLCTIPWSSPLQNSNSPGTINRTQI